ncbi:alpha/beta hydrolase [Dietzia sp. PP-33]|uniref:alpha/beta fold hydrolase n=1 Tax=Dietzia sp. PP-33 TaxID=2957500 RepID=UPI0029AA38BD|nr:alpha/beta hydrolase [Dietzia sp. PP-33]MDX2358819.1 alpha/beta hydrolase [Dietzia sp. PP-33]
MTDKRTERPRRRGNGWLTAAAVIAAVVLFLPVLLLPLTTSVPMWAWLPLLLLGLFALLWLILRRRRRAVRPMAVGVMALAAIVAVLASQTLAITPPITGPDGEPVPGSVAEMESVELGGSEQWITIRGHDASNPVLLNLGMGGPGGGGFFNSTEFRPLEEHFTVVNWDEPGTGKSYGAVPFDELDRERFVADATELTNHLRERFGQDKIYIYGVSWSSIIGIWLAQEHPELFHAFISSGQMVNTTENDRMGYELALEHLEEQGDTGRAEKLRENGPPPYYGDAVVWPYVDFLDVLNEMMGIPRYTLVVPLLGLLVPEYGYVDTINHTRGLINSFNAVYPQLEDLDFVEQAPTLEVPVFFFVGRHDVNAMPSLVEEYFDELSAPEKRLIWLEGGHGLGSADNKDLFVDVMLDEVRPLSQ